MIQENLNTILVTLNTIIVIISLTYIYIQIKKIMKKTPPNPPSEQEIQKIIEETQ